MTKAAMSAAAFDVMLSTPWYLLIFLVRAVLPLDAPPMATAAVTFSILGLVGWALIKLDFEPAPLLLGFVLGPMLEENLRRAMIISRGDATVFVTHPLSLALLLISAALLTIVLLPNIKAKREEAFQE